MAETPPVALFWGEDPFLLRMTALDYLRAAGVRAAEVPGRDWRGGELSDVSTPSLWGDRRALLVTGVQSLPEAGAVELRRYLESPSPDALCVLTMVSRAKAPPALAKLVQRSGGLLRHLEVRRQDLTRWVVERGRARGVHLSGPAAAALVETVGEDLAALDQSVEQLASAFPATAVSPDQVRSQFRGLAEGRVWDLCDRAFEGRLADALLVLRSLLEAREDPLLILGGMASRLRDLLRVKSLPERMPPAEAARAAGLRFDWQVRRYRDQARRLTLTDLSELLERVVDADRALKGGVQGEVLLPMLVAAMAGEHGVAMDTPVRVSR